MPKKNGIMRRLFIVLTFLFLTLFVVFSNGGSEFAGESPQNKQIEIVSTIFPLYDWAGNIVGPDRTDVHLTLLISNGADMHSYQPTVQDILRVQNADVLIYVGGESDEWIEEALSGSPKENLVTINLLEALGDRVKEEELVQGMQESKREAEEKHTGEVENDEHVWLSLKNAEILVLRIAEKLCEVIPYNAESYSKNASEYVNKIRELDAEYSKAVSEGAKHTLLFADRFPFRYLTEDYGLDYYAAFSGCSAETEASFETIVFLSNKIDELGLSSILTIEGANNKLPKTIRNNTKTKDQKILTLNSMQSVTN